MNFSLHRGADDSAPETFEEPKPARKLSAQLVGLIAVAAVLLLAGVYFLVIRGDSTENTSTTSANSSQNLQTPNLNAPTLIAPAEQGGLNTVTDPNSAVSSSSATTGVPSSREPFSPLKKTTTTATSSAPTSATTPATTSAVPTTTAATTSVVVSPTSPTVTSTPTTKTVAFTVKEIDQEKGTVETTLGEEKKHFAVGQSQMGITLVRISEGQAVFRFGEGATQDVPMAKDATVKLEVEG